MLGKQWAAVRRWVVTAQTSAAQRRAHTASAQAEPNDPGFGRRLTGAMTRLDRLAAVWPETVVVVFDGGEPPQLRFPNEIVAPHLLSWRHPVYVLPVSTGPATLDITTPELITFDGYRVDAVVIRVTVHFSPVDRYQALLTLAGEFRAGLGEYLLRRVEAEVTAEVEAAVRLNRLSDLRRNGLEPVLADRWLPKTFAGGALLRDGFAVLHSGLPDTDAPDSRASDHPAPEPDGSPYESGRPAALHLSVDARLQRVWQRHTHSEVYGIAGAQTGGGSTVIAVTRHEAGQYEQEQAREEYAHLFNDHGVKLVALTADSYSSLIRGWFRQVDRAPDRLVGVESVGDDDALRISVDDPGVMDESRTADTGSTVGTESARAALRHLLPHRRVEFVGSQGPG